MGVTKETIKRWIDDQSGGNSEKKGLPTKERRVNYPIWYQTQDKATASHKPHGADSVHNETQPANTASQKRATEQTNNANEYDINECKKSSTVANAQTVPFEGVQRASPFGRISVRKYSAVLDFCRWSETSPPCLDSLTLALYCLTMQAQTHGQFFHIEAYSRKVPKKRARKEGNCVNPPQTVRSVLAEAMRVDGHCPHIDLPQTPSVLFGCSPTEVEAQVDHWAESARDDAGHKLRIDGKCLLAGVTSVPNAMTDNEWQRYKQKCLAFLISTYGERLRSVVEHLDEGCRHLHFYVVPLNHESFDRLHPGRSAAKAALEKHKAASNNKPPSLRDQNAAYKSAMAALQDKFFTEVASDFGMSRKGPQGKRLTRKEYFALKQNFRNASQARENLEQQATALAERETKVESAKKLLLARQRKLHAERTELQRPMTKIAVALSPIGDLFKRFLALLPSTKKIQAMAKMAREVELIREAEAEEKRKVEERLLVYERIHSAQDRLKHEQPTSSSKETVRKGLQSVAAPPVRRLKH